jgi:copper(I)-binding protein
MGMRRPAPGGLGTLIALATLATSCGGPTPATPDLTIRDAWVRPAALPETPGGAPVNSAAYLLVENRGGAADRLLDVGFAGASRVELHESFVDSAGVARMRRVEAVDLPAGAEARLQPGGLHVMLMGLGAPLVAGDSVDLVLRFESSGERTVRAEVRPI